MTASTVYRPAEPPALAERPPPTSWTRSAAMSLTGFVLLALCVAGGLRWEGGLNLDQRMMRSVGHSAEAGMKIIDVMTAVSVSFVAICLVGCMAVALLRGRFALATSAALLIAGANLTTQVLKYHVLGRVDGANNTSPSGHTTVSLSIAIAAVLVAPAVWRWVVVPLAGFVGTFVGAGTVVGQWHRPSDVLAGVGVCLVWTGIAVAFVAAVQRRRTPAAPVPASRSLLALPGSAVAGLVFVSWGVRPQDGDVNLGLAVVSLATIGLAVAGAIAWAGSYADRHLA
ncbi:phosphatase PAP2 family protein [Luteipulveratus mongoliensis]|uniref:phosphatase PAP2 family protein n=1 Tax=Luteipulveratus mongoliensis TaxID=571913 RepID=UPI00069821AD|nr:phosphatase PAP2 family protein [Luteipulveratus mongoliensis]